MPTRDIHGEIAKKIKDHKVVLFMKGTPQMPQCGFSSQVVQILNMLGYPYQGVNVLADQELREEIKRFSDWPTIPQLYINGEFCGGCDNAIKLFESGELQKTLNKAFGDQNPQQTPGVIAVSPQQAADLLKTKKDVRLLDVRTPEEWAIAHVTDAQLIDQQKADQLVQDLPRHTPLILMCHHGRRSFMAGQFFVSQGFSEVYNMTGGIDAWAQTVDSSIPRY